MALTINGTDGIELNTDTGKIKVGADDDLELFHASSDSYISNVTNTDLIIRNLGNAGIDIKPQNSYPVKLYYNASEKLETASWGVSVTGKLRADTLEGDGTALTGLPASNRNVIYNGAMQIYQRGEQTGVGSSNGSTYALDRWQLYTQNTDSRYTISQDSESPDGFAHSLKIDCPTADTSTAANEEVILQQKIEGFDVQRFQKGTSGAKAYTLSFWAKSDKTGTYIVRLLGRDNTTSNVSKSYSIANTNWNKYTITFPADTDSSRKDNSDNGEALRVCWWLVAGSAVNTGTLQETWANTADSGAATGQVNFADSDSNDFWLTGVQREIGSVASAFEHRTYGEELVRCQRYFYSHVNGSAQTGGMASYYGDTKWRIPISFPTTMRSSPSMTCSNNSGDFVGHHSGGNVSVDTIGDWHNSNSKTTGTLGSNSIPDNNYDGQASYIKTENTTSSISFSAEL